MKLERMIAIVMILLRKDKVTAKELAKLFEVSIRTIYRDLEAINLAGVPLVTTAGVGGGVSIVEQYKVEKGIFTTNDITVMLRGLGVIADTMSSAENTNALMKLKSFVSKEQVNEINMKLNQMMFDLSSWRGKGDSKDALTIIKQALEDKSAISFDYFGHAGEKRVHFANSHRLVFKENSWYLQAFVPEKEDFRLFKVRRMSHIEIENETFVLREVPHPFSDFTNTMSHKMFPIKLRIYKSCLDKMLNYCTMDEITVLNEKELLVDFDFIADEYGYGILLSFGNQLRVLEPEYVKDEMKKRLNEIIELYEKDR